MALLALFEVDDEASVELAGWYARVGERYLAPRSGGHELLAGGSRGGRRARATRGGRRALRALTGNPEPVARARMERLGLARFFPGGEGAFGCEA